MRHLIRRATAILEEFFARAKSPYVACSYGKDSMVALWIVRQIRPDTPVVWFDGGKFDEWPETYGFIERIKAEWGVEPIVIKPELPLIEQWRRYGIPESRHTREEQAYTREFVGAFKRIIRERGFDGVVLGMRADESLTRRALLLNRGPIYTHKGEGVLRCCPLWDWRTRDVWHVIYANRIPIHPLYTSGLGPLYHKSGRGQSAMRLGCMADTCFADSGSLVRMRRLHPELWYELITEFPELQSYG